TSHHGLLPPASGATPPLPDSPPVRSPVLLLPPAVQQTLRALCSPASPHPPPAKAASSARSPPLSRCLRNLAEQIIRIPTGQNTSRSTPALPTTLPDQMPSAPNAVAPHNWRA